MNLRFQGPEQIVTCLQGGAPSHVSHRGLKLLRCEVCAVTPVLGAGQRLKWSETPITFSRADHTESTKEVERLPIVVAPTIRNLRVERVLIDGSNRLNIICPRVYQAMQIPKGELRPSMPFFGISPNVSIPRGQV